MLYECCAVVFCRCKKCEDGDARVGAGMCSSLFLFNEDHAPTAVLTLSCTAVVVGCLLVVISLMLLVAVRWHLRHVRAQSSQATSMSRCDINESMGEILRSKVEEEVEYLRRKTSALQQVKIMLSFCQCISRIGAVFNIRFPPVVRDFYKGIGAMLFNLMPYLPLGCTLEQSYFLGLYATTLAPICCIALAVSAEMAFNIWTHQWVLRFKYAPGIVLMLTFFVYTTVCSAVLEYFHCIELEDDGTYLVADMSVLCTSSEYSSHRHYVILMGVLYAIGIPALYTGLLLSNRHALLSDSRMKNKSLQRIVFLWGAYKKRWYFMEV